ncbi:MAG: NAD(P)/FAD-dependent oxidoreductase [Anaerolineales bacterium]
MKSTDYLIIGGGLAAARAVEAIREQDPEGSITLVGEEPEVPYHRPPLSKDFMQGEQPREKIKVKPPEYYEEQGVRLLLGTKVERLDPTKREAHLSSGETLRYEKALLATGGSPILPGFPGADLPEVYTLRTVEDAEAIRAAAQEGKRAVIVGAGFIGMEMAASLTELGVDVTVVEMLSHLWPQFIDESLGEFFQERFREQGINFYLDEKVEEIRGEQHVESVVTESGKEIPADFVCVAVGIRPNMELVKKAKLEYTDGVLVNAYLQTVDPNIYAAGDIMNYPDPYFGKRRRVEHWGQADYTGDLAGRNMAGAGEQYDLLTYVWSNVFDDHLEFAGDHEEYDQIVQRGEFEDASFTRFFLKRGRMTAYFAINPEDADLSTWQQLIKEEVDLSGREEQLADPSVKPTSFLPDAGG